MADTSVWIEYLRGREPIYSRFHEFLKFGSIFSVPWIFGELLQGARGEADKKRILSFWSAIPKVDCQNYEKIWIDAGILSGDARLFSRGIGLIDLAILESARQKNAYIWTLDKQLLSVVPTAHKFS